MQFLSSRHLTSVTCSGYRVYMAGHGRAAMVSATRLGCCGPPPEPHSLNRGARAPQRLPKAWAPDPFSDSG